MLQRTANSASRLAGRVSARRLVRCAVPGQAGGAGLSSMQQAGVRRFWAAQPRREKEEGDGAPAEELPWYLRVDAPKHATLAAAAEVVLPAIPAGAPGLTEPLLRFAADDLGLDELQLLDLRQLEPAAALGPELLMVFGTARSERHLHVSADRLVRWLRRFGIQATADGLLGRNELKIKLRRKARRAKLLGHDAFAGLGGDPAAVDDGISTQWVCLHVGTLGRSGEEGGVVDADGRTTGFGTVTRTGTTVVVQMMTEAKRRQLDLETLWSRALSRSLRRRAEEGEDVDVHGHERLPTTTTRTAGTGLFEQQLFQQRRPFSTSTRRLAVSSDDVLARLTRPSLEAADLGAMQRHLESSSSSCSRTARTRLLHELAQHLQRLPRAEVLEALGRDVQTTASTAPTQFVRTAEYCMRGLPAAETWAFRSAVHATALRAGHAGHDLAGLGVLVREMQLSGADLPREHALQLVRAVFSLWGPLTADAATARRQADVALAVVDTLHERGEAVLAGDVLVTAVAALARANRGGPAGQQAAPRPDTPADRLQQRLEHLLRQLTRAGRLPCPDEAQVAALLGAYAAQDDWTRFWAAWRLRPQHARPRSARLYAHVLGCVARTQQRDRCQQALRWCFHEMAHEQPPVRPAGAVLQAMRACVRVVDPQAEALVRNLAAQDVGSEDPRLQRLASREFVRLLRTAEGI